MWIYDARNDQVSSDDFCVIAEVVHEQHGQLIAAAPELLEALEDIIETYGHYENGAIERAKEVIAKAKGEGQ